MADRSQANETEQRASASMTTEEEISAAAANASNASVPQQQGEEETKEDPSAGASNGDSSMPFINQGLRLWEQSRTKWLGHKASDTSTGTDSTVRAAAVPIEVDEIIEVVFAVPQQTAGEDGQPPPRFPRTVPLPQMVDILVDLWEAEGLDI